MGALSPLTRIFQERLAATLRAAPAQVTSGLRTRRKNRDVGGDPYSQHLIGCAADLVPQAGVTYQQLADAARAARLHPVLEGDHVHVQLFPAGLTFVHQIIDTYAA